MLAHDRARLGRRPRVLSVALVGACTLAWAAAALALPPFTTAPKTLPAAGSGQAEVFRIAVGCHPAFDRFVIHTRRGSTNAVVRYVAVVEHDGSGLPVPLLGRARLHVVLQRARAHTLAGGALIPAALTPLCPNLRQVKGAGDFEGHVSFGLGLQRRTGFRLFRLTAPDRIVVDVAH